MWRWLLSRFAINLLCCWTLYSESSFHVWYCTCHVQQARLVCAVKLLSVSKREKLRFCGGHKWPLLPGRFLLLVFCGLSVLKSHPKSGYKLWELGASYDGLVVGWSVEEVLEWWHASSEFLKLLCLKGLFTTSGRAKFLKPPVVLSWV